MQEMEWVARGKDVFVRTVVGIVLFALVVGIWVCLWVPPWSAF